MIFFSLGTKVNNRLSNDSDSGTIKKVGLILSFEANSKRN